MIPHNIEAHHIIQAARHVDEHGIPSGRDSDRYDLLLNAEHYPPKLIISLAAKFARGQEWSSRRFNAVEAKNYFINREYVVFDKKTGQPLPVGQIPEADEASAFPEGREKYRLHRSLERDPTIVRKAKEERLRRVGELRCEACDFSFRQVYGDMGTKFIEAHHIVPVSEIRGKTKTKISDLALVCANCHRMLHRAKSRITVAYLRTIIEKNR